MSNARESKSFHKKVVILGSCRTFGNYILRSPGKLRTPSTWSTCHSMMTRRIMGEGHFFPVAHKILHLVPLQPLFLLSSAVNRTATMNLGYVAAMLLLFARGCSAAFQVRHAKKQVMISIVHGVFLLTFFYFDRRDMYF
jgi:hypothetical protein